MKIGIIGPSKLREKELVSQVAKIVSKSEHEVVLTADKGSSSEYFANEYLNSGGKEVFSVIPLKDREFGNSWVERIGKIIDCDSWRNQPEKLNEEYNMLISLGYSVGGVIEIGYSKWFGKHPVYIIKEFISERLPKEFEDSLDLRYISIVELEKILS